MLISPNDNGNFEYYFGLYVTLLVASVLLFYNIFTKYRNMKWLSWRYRKPKEDLVQVSGFLIFVFVVYCSYYNMSTNTGFILTKDYIFTVRMWTVGTYIKTELQQLST